ADNQRRTMAAAAGLARACDGHEVALVHGNGPQIGLLALTADAYEAVPAYPLDVLGAESQGMIGYVIAQELRNALPAREVAVLLTQTLVDPADPAFHRPTKPIGPVYPAATAGALRAARGWTFAPDGASLRRVVASPEPLDIVETPTIARLVAAGVITVCAGGGGVPVAGSPDGVLRGVEAVIDKDLAAALLAARLKAHELLILTDVDAVYLDWGAPGARPVRSGRVEDFARQSFAEGSMGPKVRAACRFVRQTGRPAVIGALEDIDGLLAGASGTRITP
ncbi:carbamate kinase, partial [Caulobacter sp.]|uniref:carbamate kinase n=1 Tax=Caulobacter sp. TaxID=78 RepID=UPI003BB1E45E